MKPASPVLMDQLTGRVIPPQNQIFQRGPALEGSSVPGSGFEQAVGLTRGAMQNDSIYKSASVPGTLGSGPVMDAAMTSYEPGQPNMVTRSMDTTCPAFSWPDAPGGALGSDTSERKL
jgi:hypothetical protein